MSSFYSGAPPAAGRGVTLISLAMAIEGGLRFRGIVLRYVADRCPRFCLPARLIDRRTRAHTTPPPQRIEKELGISDICSHVGWTCCGLKLCF